MCRTGFETGMIASAHATVGDGVDSSDTASGPEQAEAHRHLIQFLRGLSELDAALGSWRPAYGSLPAAEAADPRPRTRDEVVTAHGMYADGLLFFADSPRMARSLRQPSAGDIAAAVADAQKRFGAPIAPLDRLMTPRSPTPPQPPAAVAPGAPVAGESVPPAAGRIADSPWEAERPTAARAANGTPPGRRGSGPPNRRGRPEGEPPRPLGRGFAIVMGLAALAVIAILVAGAVFVAHALLGTGPTAAPPSATTAPATLPASDLPTASGVDVVAPAEACTAIPSGKLPSGLAAVSSASGIGSDPVAGYSNPFVSVRLASAVGTGTPAFDLIAVVLPYQATLPAASATASPSAPPVDRAGTLQLVAYWNGSSWVGALRSWSGAAWGLTIAAGSGVNISQNGATVTLFWQGLAPGDKYGVIVASAAGCADLGLSSALAPEQTYGSQPTA